MIGLDTTNWAKEGGKRRTDSSQILGLKKVNPGSQKTFLFIYLFDFVYYVKCLR